MMIYFVLFFNLVLLFYLILFVFFYRVENKKFNLLFCNKSKCHCRILSESVDFLSEIAFFIRFDDIFNH